MKICPSELHPDCAEKKEKFGDRYYCNISSEDSSGLIETQTRGSSWLGIYAKEMKHMVNAYDLTPFIEEYIKYKREFPQARIYCNVHPINYKCSNKCPDE